VKLDIKVIAGAKKRDIRLDGSILKVKLLSKPVKGKANEELVDYLAEFFHVKRHDVVIVAGRRDTRKTISLPLSEDAFKRMLASTVPTT
jgi:uncharacterized protein